MKRDIQLSQRRKQKWLFRQIKTPLVICLFAAICLLGADSARSELASESEMTRVCLNWLTTVVNDHGSWAGSKTPTVSEVQEIFVDNQLLARYYSISPKGYIIVPILKELPPIKAYSEMAFLDLNENQGMVRLIRDVLSDRAVKYIEVYGSLHTAQDNNKGIVFDFRNRRAWEIYVQEGALFAEYLSSKNRHPNDQVGPLLTTAWHQQAPYNSNCPMGDGDRCVVWCVATALAQIIYYHQWPPAGFGHTSYLWNGDQSCGGTTEGRLLVANFSDQFAYDANMENIAEICEEVGKSYNVDYGVCYSIGYAAPIFDLLPDNFAYGEDLLQLHRNEHTPGEWFTLIQEEINNDRPVDYLIYNHMIVADGWLTSGEINYYHMNYGWGGGHNAWYAIDNLYCSWPGCDPMVESMWTNIYPDREIMFYGDTIAGSVPLEIQFTASSDQTVDSWLWDFGNGDTASMQSPTYTYNAPGIYDVSLTITRGDSSRTRTRPGYIYALADSMVLDNIVAEPGQVVEVTLDGANAIPLQEMTIPIKYDGSVQLVFDSISAAGCRTESCQNIMLLHSDSTSSRLVILIQAWVSGYSEYPFLAAGSGKLLKLYFTVSPEATGGQVTDVRVEDYLTYSLTFEGSIYGQEHPYWPSVTPGLVTIEYLCGDANGDREINVGDAVHTINYVFKGGPAPEPVCAGDANGDNEVNVGDAVYVINYVFNGGSPPVGGCCP